MIRTDTLYRWATRRFGISECIGIKYCNKKLVMYGEYHFEKKIIYLNKRYIKSVGTLYRTVAHEWTHSQQDMGLYYELLHTYDYDNHPLEKEARLRERSV
jgi:hypothetical protein